MKTFKQYIIENNESCEEVKNIKFINLTPHAINIIGDINKTIPPSGKTIRIDQEMEHIKSIDGINLHRAKYGDLIIIDNKTKDPTTLDGHKSLPPPQENIIYIVSGQVLEALKDRNDVASPGELVRDEKGQPIGCKGLKIN